MTPNRRPLAVRLWTALTTGVLLGGLVLAAPVAMQAHQADCDLGTYDAGADECQISGDLTETGTKNFSHALRILTGGSIDAGGGNLTLNVNGDPGLDFTMEALTVIESNDAGSSGADAGNITINVNGNMRMGGGTKILAENNTGGGDGGNIDIDVNGDFSMAGAGDLNGALISSRKTAGAGDTGDAGNITITVGTNATATGDFTLGGGNAGYGSENGARILATGTGTSGDISIHVAGNYSSSPGSLVESGDGDGSAIQQGGSIFVVAGCELSTRGRITSKGTDFGADLVHLEGCDVVIKGLVESTGKGHAFPATLCDDNGKPANSTGCIEVVGKNITIDSTDAAGELNADIGGGGSQGTSWIDIFALSRLTITDGTGNDRNSNSGGGSYASTYAVHANAIGGSDESPGKVVAKVKEGPLTASGKTFQASTTGNGSYGGIVQVEASGDVTLNNAFLDASGDLDDSPNVDGGKIIVKAWGTGSDLSWQNGDGDARPPDGTIALYACDNLSTTGTEFHGIVPTTSTGGANCNAAKPSIPGHINFNTEQWAKCNPPPPELEIIKTPDGGEGGTINAGETASFRIEVINHGPGTANNVDIDDDLPEGLTWTEDRDQCTIEANHLHCNNIDLADNEHFIVTVEAETDAEDCGTLNNKAEADAEGVAKVSDTGSIIVECRPQIGDVSVAKVGNGTINAGQIASFVITVTSNGPDAAQNVTLDDDLPAGIVWSLSGPDAGEDCAIDTSATPDHLHCDFGTLAMEASRSVTVSGETDTEDCGEIPNTAIVAASNEGEQTPDNNQATDTVMVVCPEPGTPLLTIEKSVAGTFEGPGGIKQAEPDDELTYTLDYDLTNGPVHNGVITDTIPFGLTYVLDTATNSTEFTFFSYDSGSGVLTWKAPLVTTDGSVSYKVVVDTEAGEEEQPLINTATIDSDETDLDDDEESVFVAPPVGGETDIPVAPPTNTLDTPSGGGRDFSVPILLGFLGLIMLVASVTPRRLVGKRVPRR